MLSFEKNMTSMYEDLQIPEYSDPCFLPACIYKIHFTGSKFLLLIGSSKLFWYAKTFL